MQEAPGEYKRISGYEPYKTPDGTVHPSVPGVGNIKCLECKDGVVYATRSDGESDVTFKATKSGWERVPNRKVKGLRRWT